MRNFKKILALLLALTMVLGLGVAAFADDPVTPTEGGTPAEGEAPAEATATEYSITVKNENTNITIAGKKYTAYKLFDATYGADGKASYTISDNSYFYKTAAVKSVLDTYFDFTASAGDPHTFVVTVKEAKQDTSTKTLTDADTRALADALQPYIAAATTEKAGEETVADGKEEVKIVVGGPGYYIVDGTVFANEDEKPQDTIVAAVALTNAKPTAEVNPKADAPSVDKTIKKVENGSTDLTSTNVSDDKQTADASVGDKITYELASKVPDMQGYDSYVFRYTDTMSKGLTFNDDATVTIDTTTLSRLYKGTDGKFYSTQEAATAMTDGTNVTTPGYTLSFVKDETTGKTTITIDIINFISFAANKDKDVKISYSATINQDAIEQNNEENTVKLTYSTNPYDEHAGTPQEVLGTTPEDKTEVYTANIELTKVDGSDSTKKLTGAKFQISGDKIDVEIVNKEIYQESTDGTWYRLKDGTYTETAPTDATKEQYDEEGVKKYAKVTEITKNNASTPYTAEGYVNANGVLTFNGLGEGVYTIKELVAPDGYNLLKDAITVTISFDDSDKKFTGSVKIGSGEATTINEVDDSGNVSKFNAIKIDVQNNSGTELPSTGGIGTTIFYIIGGLLAVGAGVVLVSKKRMGKVDD